MCSLLPTRDEHLNKFGVFAASSVFQNHLGVLSTAWEEVLGLKSDGIWFIFKDISDVNTALVEASAACCIQQNILGPNTKSIPPQIPGQCFILRAPSTRAVFAPSQLSVLSHRATHESHRILVMAFKPCIVGCLWHSCICFRDLF